MRGGEFEKYGRLQAEQKKLGRFGPWMTHSRTENAHPIAFHPQLLAETSTRSMNLGARCWRSWAVNFFLILRQRCNGGSRAQWRFQRRAGSPLRASGTCRSQATSEASKPQRLARPSEDKPSRHKCQSRSCAATRFSRFLRRSVVSGIVRRENIFSNT
jgi:hypothetical protein